ncbi:MAG: phosphate acyltransferase PlsX [Clostridia bacterium]|nr:phosphate acyltransferase PlsX [Clostridia bacterium]
MKLIIDAMSGDNAPAEIVRGAVSAARTLDSHIEYILVGDEDTVKKEIASANGSDFIGSRIRIVHADEVLTMEDDPTDVVKKKKKSSMTVALHLLADGEGDALICAGNTGALYTGASLIVRTVKGIRRAAIGTLLPFDRPLLLLDSGANINVTSEYMEQFAFMGTVYMKKLYQIEMPRVGLVNNGAEAHKGTPVYVETHERLKMTEDICFVGNVEGKEIPFGKCDVLVADGFTGNIILKLIEGMGSFLMKRMKKMLFSSLATKLSAVLLKKQLKQFKQDFDASEHGGSPFLGISKPVIKAHGSSDARAILNACKQAVRFTENGVIGEIAQFAAAYQRNVKSTGTESTPSVVSE